MAIQFGGLSSGLPVNDIISQLLNIERQPIRTLETKKQTIDRTTSQFSQIEGLVSGLKTSLSKITATSVLDANLFLGRKATSSDEAVATASATDKAGIQNFTLEVERLATTTKASSLAQIGAGATEASLLSAIPGSAFQSGSFNVFVDGVSTAISVDASVDTLGDVFNRLEAVTGIDSVSIDANGTITLNKTPGSTVVLGSNGDTSNFLTRTRLDTAELSGDTFTSSGPLTLINTAATDLSAAGFTTAVTAGSTFKIGDATFDTTGKSLADILQEINNSAAAKASASFNQATGKVQLVSKETGSLAIQMEDVTGNFLAAVGLINGTDSISSQTLGGNAKFSINGGVFYSTSNSVSEDVSGLAGVTLELKKSNLGSPITVGVDRDTEPLTKAMEDFTKKFNEVISAIDRATNAENGSIGPDSRLVSFRNSLRAQLIGLNDANTTYKSLPQVGISTGAPIGGGVTQASTTLVFDKNALLAALADNPAEVENLFRGATGLFTGLKAVVDNSLAVGDETSGAGLFQAQKNSADIQKKRIDDKIQQLEDRLTRRETQLRRQFQASESLIAQYQSQGSAISSLAARLSANSG